MTAQEISHAATVASREHNSLEYWKLLWARVVELGTMQPEEMATFLAQAGKARQLDHKQLALVLPAVTKNLQFYSSLYLSMVVSAYSKSGYYNEQFEAEAVRQLRGRVHEFQVPTELSMLVNAVSKFKTLDHSFFERLSAHIASRMLLEPFHIRELSVMAVAFSKVGYLDALLAERLASRCLATVADCTAIELARVLQAFAESKQLHLCEDLWTLGSNYVGDKLLFLAPAQLVNAAFAFGKLLEVMPNHARPRLEGLFERIRYSAISGIILFQPKEIASFLQSYSRWKIAFPEDDLQVVTERLRQIKLWSSLDLSTTIHVFYALSNLVAKNSVYNGTHSHRVWTSAQTLLDEVLDQIIEAVKRNELDISTVCRVVEACSLLKTKRPRALLLATQNILVFRHSELDNISRHILLSAFRELGYDDESDFMLMLSDA